MIYVITITYVLHRLLQILYMVLHTHTHTHTHMLPQWLSIKESACCAGNTDMSSIHGLGRSPGDWHGNIL